MSTGLEWPQLKMLSAQAHHPTTSSVGERAPLAAFHLAGSVLMPPGVVCSVLLTTHAPGTLIQEQGSGGGHANPHAAALVILDALLVGNVLSEPSMTPGPRKEGQSVCNTAAASGPVCSAHLMQDPFTVNNQCAITPCARHTLINLAKYIQHSA